MNRVLNISTDGDYSISLCNLFLCLTTCRIKKCFLVFRLNFMCFNLCSLCSLSLVLSVNTSEENQSILFIACQVYAWIVSSQAFFSLG